MGLFPPMMVFYFFFLFHLAAFRAKFARFFCLAVALGSLNTTWACTCTDLPAFLADAVNFPRFLGWM
jgi:hypothetical protein